jgi:hypothetical protein
MKGEEGTATVILNPDDEAVSLEYHVTYDGNESEPWKIQFMQIIPNPSASEPDNQPTPSQMMSTVKQLLDILKKKDYVTFYNHFISSDIKRKNSQEQFEAFFKVNSIFSTYQSFNLKEPYIENNHGLITVELQNEEGRTTVEFSLKTEDHDWKVTGIRVEKPLEMNPSIEDKNVKGFKSRDLITVIQSFLSSLQKGDMAAAYKKFTSGFFQEANSLDQFKEFIQKHSELTKGSSSSFEKIMFNNNIATLSGKLHLSNSLYLPV